jgi:hypothetical protein
VPPSRKRGTKQCQFREGRDRCPYDADDPDTGLCRTHQLLAAAQVIGRAAAGSGTARRVAERVRDIADNFLRGKGVKAADVGDVLREAAANGIREAQAGGWGIGGGYGYGNEGGDMGGPIPGPGSQRRAPRPPPPPPPDVELQRQLAHARATLGIDPRTPITVDLLRARHRELAKKFHPDRHAGQPAKQKAATAKMQEINAAKDTLEQWLHSQ